MIILFNLKSTDSGILPDRRGITPVLAATRTMDPTEVGDSLTFRKARDPGVRALQIRVGTSIEVD